MIKTATIHYHGTIQKKLRLRCSSQALFRISCEDWNVRRTHIKDVQIKDVQTTPDIGPIFMLESILKVILFVTMHASLSLVTAVDIMRSCFAFSADLSK